MKPPSITRVLATFEGLGLIERMANPRDGRQVLVQITPLGGNRMSEHIRANELLLEQEQLATLTQQDRELLARASVLLDQLAGHAAPDISNRSTPPVAAADVAANRPESQRLRSQIAEPRIGRLRRCPTVVRPGHTEHSALMRRLRPGVFGDSVTTGPSPSSSPHHHDHRQHQLRLSLS